MPVCWYQQKTPMSGCPLGLVSPSPSQLEKSKKSRYATGMSMASGGRSCIDVHSNPSSGSHVGLEPSPASLLPSSQSSLLSTMPSPHIEMHSPTGLVSVPHTGSFTQLGEHPS